jgi:hypothetical protein
MDNLLRFLLRLIVVPLGLMAGLCATMAVIIIGYWRVGDLLSGAVEVQAFDLLEMLVTATVALTAVALTMWAIALIGILFAETFAIRSWIYHVTNGAISAWLGAEVFAPYTDTPVPFDGNFYVIAAGLTGGLAYWLVAGWSAGFWKPVGKVRSAAVPAPAPSVPPPPTTAA